MCLCPKANKSMHGYPWHETEVIAEAQSELDDSSYIASYCMNECCIWLCM